MPQDSFAMKRRAALKAMGLGAAATAMSAPISSGTADQLFQHGVASGDPLSDRVILWTRVTPLPGQDRAMDVRWEVLSEGGDVATSGMTQALPKRDYTVKVDASGLKPGTQYRYRFQVGDAISPEGKTRTLPVGAVDSLTIAACSCSNYPYGFFNVYKEMAANPDIDLVLHLGDYIYEYALKTYSSKEIEAAGRTVLPENEIVTLADYRQRYGLYRKDADLQAVHAAHPFITVWDDHEFTNDAWTGGAENHQPEKEGDWAIRREAALQAYDEWMPTRADMRKPWRSFDVGSLARIIMLDTRVWGRDKQLSYADDLGQGVAAFKARLEDPDRQLLGKEQEAWLTQSMASAKDQTWQILGQQVLMGRIAIPGNAAEFVGEQKGVIAERIRGLSKLAAAGLPLNMDAWDGYPAARARVLETVRDHGSNVVVLAGDTHNAWLSELTDGKDVLAHEFATASVSSPGFEGYVPADPGLIEQSFLDATPTLKWVNTQQRGYLTLTFTPEKAHATFYRISTAKSRDYDMLEPVRFALSAADGTLKRLG